MARVGEPKTAGGTVLLEEELLTGK
jgi:hypothetical protein